ncbi:hypothetical protein ZWY2020_038787 [Hordeum vulgare]|nr:hypothetical protein ZWY2020_038787 [Hordeum vulgare]
MAGDADARFLLVVCFAASILLPSRAQPATPTEVKGFIIDAGSPVGKIATTTIPMALEDFYAAYPNSSARVRVLQHDSGGDVVAAASAALQLMTAQGARHPRPAVPSVSPATARFFARAALSDALQADAIAALATYFGWRRVVPIYQDDDYGAAFVPFLVDALTAERTEVPYRCALPAAASNDAIAAALLRMESEQTRVFVLHTRPGLAKNVFIAAMEAGMVDEGYVWVITDGLTGLLGSVDPPQGVIGLTPYVPTTTRLREVKKRWAHRYMRDHRHADPAEAVMGCYALWAYDAAWAVASAAERLSSSDYRRRRGW